MLSPTRTIGRGIDTLTVATVVSGAVVSVQLRSVSARARRRLKKTDFIDTADEVEKSTQQSIWNNSRNLFLIRFLPEDLSIEFGLRSKMQKQRHLEAAPSKVTVDLPDRRRV